MANEKNITTKVPIYLSLIALFLTTTAFIWLSWKRLSCLKEDTNFKDEILKVDQILNEVVYL